MEIDLKSLHAKLMLLCAKRYAPAAVACGVPMLAMPIAMLAPVNILSCFPEFVYFVNFVEGFVPLVNSLAAPTAFPEVARLYYSFILALSPPWLYLMMLVPEDRLAPIDYIKRNKKWYPFALVALLSLQVWFCFFYSSSSPAARLTGVMSLTAHSRLWLSILGGLSMLCFVMVPYIFIVWVKWIPRNTLNKSVF